MSVAVKKSPIKTVTKGAGNKKPATAGNVVVSPLTRFKHLPNGNITKTLGVVGLVTGTDKGHLSGGNPVMNPDGFAPSPTETAKITASMSLPSVEIGGKSISLWAIGAGLAAMVGVYFIVK
jgi:hypothetical protein